MELRPYKKTKNSKMEKTALKHKILTLEGLTNEEKSALLELLNKQKKYGLVWEEKPEDVEERLRDSLPVFKEVKSRAILSDSPDAPNHILIEGDNLEALTALSYTHEGKIDVIYIDPPYNTGNKDFIYNDSFVDSEDGYRHSKWLSFMSKRLKIAKRLLSDKGVIFISIANEENHNLKILCDEIYGERNFISQLIWHNNKKGRQMDKYIKTTCEYVLMYCKYIESIEIADKLVEVNESLYDDKDDISLFKKGYPLHNGTAAFHIDNRPNLCYTIYYNPLTSSIYTIDEKVGSLGNWQLPISVEGSSLMKKGYVRILPKRNTKYNTQRVWRWGQEKTNREVSELMFVQETDGWYIYQKDRVEDGGTKSIKHTNYFDLDTSRGRSLLNDIFNNQTVFDFPKPLELVNHLLSIVKNGNTILDFFAGSGTTLHATMQLNSEDGGHRQCILVTNNENKICEEVTYERNKRVINGYTTPKGEEVEGLKNNSLRYYKTELLPREKSPRNMRALMAAATELLCIKEDLYEESKRFGRYRTNPKTIRYFEKGNKRMLIIFCEELADQIAEEIKTLDFGGDKLKVYIFSPDRYAFDDNFYEVQDKVTLVALPAAIYDAYRRVLPKRIDKPLLEVVADERLTSTVAAGETPTLPEAAQQSIDFNFE